jgi:hypothetical protein
LLKTNQAPIKKRDIKHSVQISMASLRVALIIETSTKSKMPAACNNSIYTLKKAKRGCQILVEGKGVDENQPTLSY